MCVDIWYRFFGLVTEMEHWLTIRVGLPIKYLGEWDMDNMNTSESRMVRPS